jgi:hypothetical protein
MKYYNFAEFGIKLSLTPKANVVNSTYNSVYVTKTGKFRLDSNAVLCPPTDLKYYLKHAYIGVLYQI